MERSKIQNRSGDQKDQEINADLDDPLGSGRGCFLTWRSFKDDGIFLADQVNIDNCNIYFITIHVISSVAVSILKNKVQVTTPPQFGVTFPFTK